MDDTVLWLEIVTGVLILGLLALAVGLYIHRKSDWTTAQDRDG